MHYGVEGLLLTALGGYFVVERSAAQKGRVRKIGQLVGVAVIVLSFFGIACRVWYGATCPMHRSGKGWYCPFGMKVLPGGPAGDTSAATPAR
jgi:hypothetical protein